MTAQQAAGPFGVRGGRARGTVGRGERPLARRRRLVAVDRGGAVEAKGRQGAAVVTAGLALVVVLELVVAGLALALAHPPAVGRWR